MTSHARRRLALATVVVLVLDLATKWWATTALADGPVDLGWITLRLSENPGIAFSLGASAPAWLITGLTVAATTLIAVMALRGSLRPALAAGLLLGGGLGNLLDRLAGGTVTDFLDLGWFPSFNVADVALNVGVALLLVAGFRAGDADGEAQPTDATGHTDPTTAERG